MYERSRNFLLRWLKVPPEPHAPLGDPASLRVFRAGRNYFRLRLLGWSVAQLAALAGIVFWTVVLVQVEHAAQEQKLARASQVPPAGGKTAGSATPVEDWKKSFKDDIEKVVREPGKKSPRHINNWAALKQVLVEVAVLLPDWAFPVIWFLKVAGIILYLAQIPLTYAVRRLDYEMRWYVVTDRSLRIRTGVWSVQELTMSFANLQQVVVTQGPVQRLLGLADVLVKSAGGGMGVHQRGDQESSLHSGYFHGVEHASEIRDLIQARLRHFRESGLGDPEEARRLPPPAAVAGPGGPAPGPDHDLLAAAREFRDEARALRVALG